VTGARNASLFPGPSSRYTWFGDWWNKTRFDHPFPQSSQLPHVVL
jgi:hypothetical protein